MRIGLVAGETSGDLLGAGLIKELRALSPDMVFEGVAGPAMQAAGCEAWESSEALAVMGLIEPLREIPRLLKLRSTLVRRWTNDPPDVFVGIDAPDFNLGLETRLRQQGIRTAHYVSPSVWAWRQGRVRKVDKAADSVLCLLPFEKAFYDRHDVAAVFVGHPMADRTPADLDVMQARSALGLEAESVVAVLPGSRMSEVSRLAPVFVAACAKLAAAEPATRFVAPMTNGKIWDFFESQLARANLGTRFLLTDGNAETAMAAADVVLLASGTATLQAALLGRPMVAAYKIAPVTYAIMWIFRLLKIKYFTLPNNLTVEPLVPEFLQGAATPTALADAVSDLMQDPARRTSITDQFAALLGRPMVAAYKIAPVTFAIMWIFRLLKIKYFTLPNNLTVEPLVPEFLQGAATPTALADAVSDLMQDPARRTSITDQFAALRTELAQGADKRAAQAVFELAGGEA